MRLNHSVIIVFLLNILQSQISISLDPNPREVPLFGIANSSMRYNDFGGSGIEYDFGEADFNSAALCINPRVLTFPGANPCYFDWEDGWSLDSTEIVNYVNTLESLVYTQDIDSYSDAETPGEYFFNLSNRDYKWWENADETWEPIHIGVDEFSSFIAGNNIKGTFSLNMLTSSIDTTMDMVRVNYGNGVPFEYIELGSEYYLRGGGDKWEDEQPRNYKYDAGETLKKDKDGDGKFDPGRFDFIYPTPQSFALECNKYIDSLSTILPANTKYAISSKNKPGDPRSDDWTRQVLENIHPQLIAMDTINLTWHEYLRYETNEDSPGSLTEEQVLAFPQFMHEDGRMITDSGMDTAKINQLEIDLNKKIRLWLTESAFKEINYSWGEKPWIFKWAQTLVNIQNYALMLRNTHLDIIMLQALHGTNETSAINHGHQFPPNVPEYNGEDSCSPYGRTATAFSIYFWDYISEGMTHMQEIIFNNNTTSGDHKGTISEDPENRDQSPDINYVYSYLLGWRLNNTSREEKAIIINVADISKTIRYDANDPIFTNSNMRCIQITSLNSDGEPSIDQYINGDGDLNYDTTDVVSGMTLPSYSVNLFEPHILGCTNASACNFDPAASVDDGSCEYCLCQTCSDNATCTNTDGSFTCACNSGWEGVNGTSCIDIDECATNNGGCDSDATCANTDGSFTCACNSGWEGANGTSCTDIDECATNNGGCDSNATCANTDGSFTCACNSGWEGANGTSCTDIDECATNNGGCDSNATCENNEGAAPTCSELSLFNGLIPEDFSLHSIYPNPFNPVTNIIYGLPEYSRAQIVVYDLTGKHIETLINEYQKPGYHSATWNGNSVPSGLYICRLSFGSQTITQKMLLMK